MRFGRTRGSRFLQWSVLLLAVSGGAVAGGLPRDCAEVDAVALQWLDKMSKSVRLYSYQGVVTLQRGDDMQVMQISHSVDQGFSYEQLTELTGQGAQIERDAHPLDCLHPGDQMLRMDSLTDTDSCGIARYYHFSVGDNERVAGRSAVTIKIAPRDLYRFGYVMALDRETGLLLKSRTIGHGYRTLETMQFAQLSYSEVNPAVVDPALVHKAQHPRSPAGQASVAAPVVQAWTVRQLPPGFVPTDATLGNDGRRTYTDGLAVFSVFLEDLNVEIRPGEGVLTQGSTTTYTRGMSLSGQPVLVTVIGDVPVNTARIVADSVTWVP